MYTIAKKFQFSAAHHLPHLSEGHPCRRHHGHNYQVEVILRADRLDSYDFVVDYGELREFKDFIDSTLDHQDLNNVLPCYTTAENIARFLYHWCKERWWQTYAMRVSETPNTWAEYTEDA